MSSRRTSVRARYDLTKDFYETPAWATDAILRRLNLVALDVATTPSARADVLDPCAGRGAILYRAGAVTPHVHGFELDEGRWRIGIARGFTVEHRDALSEEPWGDPEVVLMNPPFALAEEFVRRAIDEVSMGGGHVIALLRLAFLEGLSRSALHRDHPSDVYILPRRPAFILGRTDSCAYAWFHWHLEADRRWEILDLGRLPAAPDPEVET